MSRHPNIRTDSEKRCILLVDAGYFLTREVHRALEQEGHQVVLLSFRIPTDVPVPDAEIYSGFLKAVMEAAERFHPHALLTINHLGFDAEGRLTELLDALELPTLVWYVDSPRYILLDHYANVSDGVGIFLWEEGYRLWMEQIGFDKIHNLPLATDPEVFGFDDGDETIEESAPLVFVGDSMNAAVEKAFSKLPDCCRTSLSEELDDPVSLLAREFCGMALSNSNGSRLPAWDLLWSLQHLVPGEIRLTPQSGEFNDLAGRILPNQDWLNLESALVLLATRLQRTQFVSRLDCDAAYRPMIIYGDEGWKQTLSGKTRVLPPVDYYNELPRIYGKASAVVNLTGLQMPQALNQRCYDVTAAGGFLMTDHQSSLADQFAPDTEMVTFQSTDELIDKWKYYKTHPEERLAVIAQGRRRVLQEHTYRHRVREMLEVSDAWFY